MSNFLLRGIPDDVKEKLQQNATLHGRSLNKEIIEVLKKVKKEVIK